MLRQNRGRSLVTIFGIVIGLVAVILIIGIGEGVKQQVQSQVNRLGRDLIMVRPGSETTGITGSIGTLSRPTAVPGLDNRDFQAVASAKGVRQAVPLSTIDGVVKSDEPATSFKGAVVATNAGFVDVVHQKVQYGSFLSNGEGSDERAVIGADVAVSLFKETVPLGRTFEFRGKEFIVSGILDKFDSNPLLADADFNNAIFINYTVAQQLTADHVAIYQILAQVSNAAKADETARAIDNKLSAVHGGSKNYEVLQQGQSAVASDAILDLLTRFIIGAAAIALLIGGVGVMNIMLVSVTERMHEIGIRKAVGATNRQILSQFMLESTVLSAIGGLLGFIVAGVGIWLLRLFTDLQPTMPWMSASVAVLLAIGVGTIFGCFPAIKAARKDPIEALRNE
jgi:ABC-type antimicrobial peptide transport system permease subunit